MSGDTAVGATLALGIIAVILMWACYCILCALRRESVEPAWQADRIAEGVDDTGSVGSAQSSESAESAHHGHMFGRPILLAHMWRLQQEEQMWLQALEEDLPGSTVV